MNLVIGILGGMGTYATIHLFQQYAHVFPAEKEWERPRIVIDNRCTMPSRVRAFLYNEHVDELVNEMTDSMQHLMDIGCNRILLACNTSHLFLPMIYEKAPGLKSRVINIIETAVNTIASDGVKEVYVLGSEGTIESRIYQDAFGSMGITCKCPKPDEYSLLRECIEAVKQDCYSEQVKDIFLSLVNGHNHCVLGCTELPILYEKYKDDVTCKYVYDPLLLGLLKIKKEFDDE